MERTPPKNQVQHTGASTSDASVQSSHPSISVDETHPNIIFDATLLEPSEVTTQIAPSNYTFTTNEHNLFSNQNAEAAPPNMNLPTNMDPNPFDLLSDAISKLTSALAAVAPLYSGKSDNVAPYQQCLMSGTSTRHANLEAFSTPEETPVASNIPPPITNAGYLRDIRPTAMAPGYSNLNSYRHQVPGSFTPAPQVSAYVHKLYDLPSFSGQTEDWPMFLSNFEDTTREFHYSNRQNLMRLQKSLTGKAKEAVASMLIYPDDVPNVIQELAFRFGRPELLLYVQLSKIKQFPTIAENKPEQLIEFSTKVRNVVAFLLSAKCHQHLGNPSLLDELVCKLPLHHRYEWSKHWARLPAYPTIVDFSSWLSDLAKVISRIPFSPSSKQNTQSSNSKPLLHVQEEKGKQINCFCCNKDHVIEKCEEFEKKSVQERWEVVKENRLCFSCLKKGHSSLNCRSKQRCETDDCSRFHHKKLHDKSSKPPSETTSVLSCKITQETSDLLYKILPIRLYGPNGLIETYAMFDDGAGLSIIDNEITKKLGLKGQTKPLSIQWYGNQTHTEPSMKVDVEVEHSDQICRFLLEGVRTVNNLNLPLQSFNKNDYPHLQALPLQNYNNAKPKILIGLDNAHLFAEAVHMQQDCRTPIAIETKLGWVACGKTNQKRDHPPIILHMKESIAEDLHEVVKQYFCLDSFGTNVAHDELESEEDKHAKKLLQENTKRTGKNFETALLWKRPITTLPNSYTMAEKRLFGIERKIQNDPTFGQKYHQGIEQYLKKGYARKLKESEKNDEQHAVWYLPHFAVENVNKPGKVRIVFDAAAKVGESSLNSYLLKGPERAKPLLNILFRFRQKPVAVAADIREMFSQIKIRTSDQQAQRFLWKDEDDNIQHYIMTSMIFGAVCSPCCAEYVKNTNASEFYNEFPEAAAAIIENHYVDDFVMSFEDEEEAFRICSEVKAINAEGGFELRNFISNSTLLQAKMNDSELPSEINLERQAAYEKVLGMAWNTSADTLVFRTKFTRIPRAVIDGNRVPTKRELLGIVMAIFDPFGILADFLIASKLLVQQTWKFKTGWDESIPSSLHEKWRWWWRQLQNIKNIEVNRLLSFNLFNADVQLHIFVDASQEAFAAVAYVRAVKKEGIDVSFVCGKTRTAPLKLISVPRLELQAAVLGTRLSKLVIENHDIQFTAITFWSDSRTVLYWLNSATRKYKPYVAHRVAEILSSTNERNWKWVPTSENPADAATRSIDISKNKNDGKWLCGPSFLRKSEDNWPAIDFDEQRSPTEEEVMCDAVLHCQVTAPLINITNFSEFLRLKRTVARVLRFIHNLHALLPNSKRQRIDGPIKAFEGQKAEITLCRMVQEEVFADEIRKLKNHERISKSSVLYSLSPQLEDDGLIRAAGRIDAAMSLPFSVRRPILLPPKHPLTQLIMEYFHKKFHHINTATIINESRQRFWIPRAKSGFKAIQKSCLTCQHSRNKPFQPRMGQLPPDRVTPYVRPFTYTGVDLFGPFTVTIGRRHEKRWAVIFTCLTVRAVHLELAESLSTDAFLISLRNFINRRGTPTRLRSDNGTNFIGAERELNRDCRRIDVDRLEDEACNKGIEWVFNCPVNPSAGGCWERLIRIVKNLLAKSLKETAPRIETLRAALIEAENILNSRPLTDIPLNYEEEEPLTPNDFLLGCTSTTQTPYLNEGPICLKKQWLIIQNLRKCMWKRWLRDYLPQLLHRSKWHEASSALEVDDLVLIVDANGPRNKWVKGRITMVFTAKDGQVRSAEVKTSSGSLRRPINKLVKLNVGKSPSDLRGEGC